MLLKSIVSSCSNMVEYLLSRNYFSFSKLVIGAQIFIKYLDTFKLCFKVTTSIRKQKWHSFEELRAKIFKQFCSFTFLFHDLNRISFAGNWKWKIIHVFIYQLIYVLNVLWKIQVIISPITMFSLHFSNHVFFLYENLSKIWLIHLRFVNLY